MKKFLLLTLISVMCSQHLYSASSAAESARTLTIQEASDKLSELGFNLSDYRLTQPEDSSGFLVAPTNGDPTIFLTPTLSNQAIVKKLLKHPVTNDYRWIQRQKTRNNRRIAYNTAGGVATLLSGLVATRCSRDQVPTGFKTIATWGGDFLSVIAAAFTTGVIDGRIKTHFEKRDEIEVELAAVQYRLGHQDQETLKLELGSNSYVESLVEQAQELRDLSQTDLSSDERMFKARETAALKLLRSHSSSSREQ